MSWRLKLVPGTAPDGGPVVSVLAKRTYRIRHEELAQPDPTGTMEWVESDEFWGVGDPARDAVKLESDLVPWKPGTDVVVVGKAHAPRGKRARFFDAGIQVGAVRKAVRIFGDRKVVPRFSGHDFSEPEPFDSMPLHYGHAYGGRCCGLDGLELPYPPNPVGKGFIVGRSESELFNLSLPNLENPQQVLVPRDLVLDSYDDWRRSPLPWALGYTGKNFHPRLLLAGLPADQSIEAEIGRLRARTEPDGAESAPSALLNPDFFRGASSGLSLPHLRGDEEVVLGYMDPDRPTFRFRLPGDRPVLRLDVGTGPERMETVLQDVVVFKGSNQISMVWRGSCRYDGPESMRDWRTVRMEVEDGDGR
jgi:hypothetical protein